MEAKKSQGPSVAAIAGSAVLVCAVLVGAALWLHDDGEPATADVGPVAASTLQPIYDRCESEISQDVVDGRARIRCDRKSHPAFILEVRGAGDEIDTAKMLMPVGGTMNEVLDRMLVGLEMFGLVAGVRVDQFMPKEHTDAIGTSRTSLVYQGRVYTTDRIPTVGLIFAVTPEESESARTN
jgi:hypothetical protein